MIKRIEFLTQLVKELIDKEIFTEKELSITIELIRISKEAIASSKTVREIVILIGERKRRLL